MSAPAAMAETAKIEVGAVGLVREAPHPGGVGHFDNGPQIAANAIVGGVVYQHRHRVRVFGDGLRHLLPAHPQGNAQTLVYIRIDVHRHRAAQDQGIDHALMDVAGQNDLIPPLAGSQDHALHGTCGTADHQKRMGCAKGLSRQLFRLQDDRYRMAEVVQRLHAVHVYADTLLPQKCGQLRIAPAPLVARHVKGNDPHLPEGLQRLVDGRAVLVGSVRMGTRNFQFLCGSSLLMVGKTKPQAVLSARLAVFIHYTSRLPFSA